MKYLKLIKDNLTLKATKGKETLARADDIFQYIDSDFKSWGLDKKSENTNEVKLAVFELVINVDYRTMFGELSNDLDKLCLTQAQVIEFVKSYPDQLKQDGYVTFFMFKKDSKYFVAHVDFHSYGCRQVYVRRFEDAYVWNAGRRHRLVVPQLDSGKLESSDTLTLDSLDVRLKKLEKLFNLENL